ncbi:MAG: acyloxyacyl hydrolase [Campylobacterales bacterium]|nr:acyloxyacyl hydrolase [Campylobacterales bacterium]
MKKWVLILSLCCFTVNGMAEDKRLIDEVTLGIGESKDNIGIYRLGARKNFDKTFFDTDYGRLSGYYEASLNYWEKGGDHIYGIALSPVFVYYFGNKSNSIHPYIEGGIGVACLSDTKIQNRDMSSNLNFEDRVGVGIRMESFDFNARYLHYSNAEIVQPNDGIDIFIFTISYIF